MICLSNHFKTIQLSLPPPHKLLPNHILHLLVLNFTLQPGNNIEVHKRSAFKGIIFQFDQLVAQGDELVAQFLLAHAWDAPQKTEDFPMHRPNVLHFGQKAVNRFHLVFYQLRIAHLKMRDQVEDAGKNLDIGAVIRVLLVDDQVEVGNGIVVVAAAKVQAGNAVIKD